MVSNKLSYLIAWINRFVYLLFIGRWRSDPEVAFTTMTDQDNKPVALISASARDHDNYKIWWVRDDDDGVGN